MANQKFTGIKIRPIYERRKSIEQKLNKILDSVQTREKAAHRNSMIVYFLIEGGAKELVKDNKSKEQSCKNVL